MINTQQPATKCDLPLQTGFMTWHYSIARGLIHTCQIYGITTGGAAGGDRTPAQSFGQSAFAKDTEENSR